VKDEIQVFLFFFHGSIKKPFLILLLNMIRTTRAVAIRRRRLIFDEMYMIEK
jgi:hypothetical protein